MTNYERIKAMSAEEMARFIVMVVRLYGGSTPCNVEKWLNSEVENSNV